jgi:glycosyltransferase involved in cell wall biosynthesis
MMSGVPQSKQTPVIPAVSVILPAFNRLEYLRQAVDSVFAQTFTDWELIIADDGSDAATISYLAGLESRGNVKVLRLAHTGIPSAVRNAALQTARGEFVAFLDSDDIWLPRKLEIQVEALRGDCTRRWSYTAVRRIGPDGSLMSGESARAWVPYAGAILEQLLTLEAAVATPTVLAERGLVEEAGAFDAGQQYFEEYDLWLRLIQRSEVAVITEPLACVRSHDEHYTHDRVAVYEARSRLLDKAKAIATTARLRSTLRTERGRNATWLANAYANRGLRARALRTLWHSRSDIRGAWHWAWRPTVLILGRALAPTWLQRLVSSVRRRRRALALGRA